MSKKPLTDERAIDVYLMSVMAQRLIEEVSSETDEKKAWTIARLALMEAYTLGSRATVKIIKDNKSKYVTWHSL